MATYTQQDSRAYQASVELTDTQRHNLKKILRKLAKGQAVDLATIPDIGQVLPTILADLIDAFNEDGIRGFKNAATTAGVDYPIITSLLEISAYKLLNVNELLNLPDQSWLVAGLLYEDALAVFYGLPGCNKSFITLGLACCMAMGWNWNGRKCTQCRVIYVAAEGARGYRRRLLAFCKDAGLDPDMLMNNLLFLKREVPLFEQSEVEAFIDELKLTVEEIEEDTSERLPIVIILDTIFQCSAGQNLNATEVMSALTQQMKHIKRETSAIQVIACHHSGKDTSKGMTGNIALKANVDVVYYVESDNEGLTKISNNPTVGKVKDDEPIEFYLQRHQVIYGDGPRDNSCVMKSAERPASEDKMNQVQANVLGVLPSDKCLTFTEWLDLVNTTYPSNKTGRNGSPLPYVLKNSMIRYIKALVDLRVVEKLGPDRHPEYRRCVVNQAGTD